MRHKMTKTKNVDGVSLGPSCFAYVGDEQDTNTWKLPIRFPGDNDKTVNHIKNGLRRFDEMKHIPQNERMVVWLTLTGAAKAHGIHVEHKPKRVEAETKAVELNRDDSVLTDAELGAILADADRKADEMLRMLGLER
jgi:hypothetical protein